jgi:Family of unknown function (DUF6364)
LIKTYIFREFVRISIAMETKLTLRLKKRTIEKAKGYAHHHNISLSKMVETYFESISQAKTNQTEITPLVESLSGVIQLDKDRDYKSDYANYLIEKYK